MTTTRRYIITKEEEEEEVQEENKTIIIINAISLLLMCKRLKDLKTEISNINNVLWQHVAAAPQHSPQPQDPQTISFQLNTKVCRKALHFLTLYIVRGKFLSRISFHENKSLQGKKTTQQNASNFTRIESRTQLPTTTIHNL